MNERDRLAADLKEALHGDMATSGGNRWPNEGFLATFLLAHGWTRDPGACGCTIHDDRGVPCPNHSDICAECHRVCWGSVYPLDEGRLARALFVEIGWPTRYPHFNLPDGLRTGDGDNPAWSALAAAIAKAYREDTDA